MASDVAIGAAPFRRLTYLAAALVALFEGGVLAASALPDVSDDYRRFFIERSTNCWVSQPAGERRFNQNIAMHVATGGDPDRLLGKLMLLCGWLQPADSGTWSRGPESAFRIDVSTIIGSDLVVHLEMLPYIADNHPQQTVRVIVAGETLADIVLREGSSTKQVVRIPAKLVASAPDGKLDLWFNFPDAVSPREIGYGDDGRKLAIRIISFRLEPVPPESSSAAPG